MPVCTGDDDGGEHPHFTTINQYRLDKDEARLQAEVEEMLRRAEQTDKQEDQLYGGGQDEEDLPAELSRREERLKRIRAAKAELEKEAAEGWAAELREQAERADIQ